MTIRPTTVRKEINSQKKTQGDSIVENRQVFYYRCPRCHHIMEREQLFGIGCPVCGWTSPLNKELEGDSRRKAIIDIFDEGDRLRILAELPGVEEENIKIKLEGRALVISADNTYYREIALPCPARGNAKTTFNNGILEVIVRK